MEFTSDTVDAQITAHTETTRDSLKRSRILANIDAKKIDPDDEQAAYFWHPNAVCCSIGTVTYKDAEPVTKSIRALTLEEFHELPGALWDKWITEVMECNPHLFARETVDAKKN